jgi:hypothetical protein
MDLDEEEREDVFYLVRRLDNAYLEHREKKRPSTGGKGGKQPIGKGKK